ncbi:MAG: hypothetical protein Q4A81_00880 [Pasteurellaceae bacterium]|nr:hypothetical protein [Pasteurellaceae bacterium]
MTTPYLHIIIKQRNGVSTVPLILVAQDDEKGIYQLEDSDGYRYFFNKHDKTLKNEYGDCYNFRLVNP